MDDVLTTASSINQLEIRLVKILNTCRRQNIKLNPDKFDVGTSVVYGGCQLSSVVPKKGSPRIFIDPTTTKIDALVNMDPPRDRKGAQVLIGMVNQLSSWVPELSLKAKGMRQLTSFKTPFMWTDNLDQEWAEVKKAIKAANSLSPIDTTLPSISIRT